MRSTFRKIPSTGIKNGAEGLNFIGIGVLAHGENLKFIRSLMMASLACIKPNRMPMQLLENN